MNLPNEQKTISAHAPGRIELLGNHTDYNQGLVLGAAIDRGVTLSGSPAGNDRIHLRSASFGQIDVPLATVEPRRDASWANYSLGVVSLLMARGIAVEGFSADIESDLPPGQGLSSSAALEVATACFVLKLAGASLPPLDLAKVCQSAEHHFVGVQSGLLDQVTSIFGRKDHVVFFDSRSEDVRTVSFPPDLVLVICQSGTERRLAHAPYNLRRRETNEAAKALGVEWLRDVSLQEVEDAVGLSPLLRKRAMHIAGENERVLQAVSHLVKGDGHALGALMYESHESSRINFENSTAELDLLVDIAKSIPGVLGSRLTGAGFGGSTVTLCRREAAHEAMFELLKKFKERTSLSTDAFVCSVGDGAH